MGQLSLWTTTYEAWVHRAYALQQEKPLHRENGAMKQRAAPCSQQLEKTACSNEDPAQPKQKKMIQA